MAAVETPPVRAVAVPVPEAVPSAVLGEGSAPKVLAVEGEERVRVYVWDAIVRLTHWTIVFAIAVLAVTGVYIGDPFLDGQFVMGWMKVVHMYAAIAFTLAVCSRIAWMFLGPRRSGWRQFVPVTKQRWRDGLDTLKFYTFLRKSPPPARGHNPVAGAAYVAVFGLYLVMIATGFAMYSASSYSFMRTFDFLLPIFNGGQGARWLHHIVMWLLLGFAIQHVYSSILMSAVERNGTMDSIFTGYKQLPKDLPEDDA